MSVTEGERGGRRLLSAFQGTAPANPDDELKGAPTALAMAIAEAAKEAANHLTEQDIPIAEFHVSRIQMTVRKNPGPTSYKVTITPTG